MDGGYAQRRLDGEGGDRGGAKEAVRGEDLEVGSDACTAGGIEAGDGESCRGLRGGVSQRISRGTQGEFRG